MSLATCKTCSEDYELENMFQDIEGANYCWVDAGNICLVCGVYGHNCEEREGANV